jgi:hypothetical protein
MSNSKVHIKLTIKNTGVGFNELIGIFTKKGNENPRPFNSLIPMPKEIWLTEATSYDDTPDSIYFKEKFFDKKRQGASRPLSKSEVEKYKQPNSIKANLFKKHGVKNWRQWSFINWGATWDASNIKIKNHSKEEVQISFTSDWPIPWKILEVIPKKFPKLSLAYDIYCFEVFFVQVAGYAPDFPFSKEEHCYHFSSGARGVYPILSEKFLGFCKRFSKFPIGGTVLVVYDPSIKGGSFDSVRDAKNGEEK